jgi:hypothetical protein
MQVHPWQSGFTNVRVIALPNGSFGTIAIYTLTGTALTYGAVYFKQSTSDGWPDDADAVLTLAGSGLMELDDNGHPIGQDYDLIVSHPADKQIVLWVYHQQSGFDGSHASYDYGRHWNAYVIGAV